MITVSGKLISHSTLLPCVKWTTTREFLLIKMGSFYNWLTILFALAVSSAQFLEGNNQWTDRKLPQPGPVWNNPELGGSGPMRNDPNSVGLKTKALIPRLFQHGLNWVKRNWIKPHWAQPAWLHPGGPKPNWGHPGPGGHIPGQTYPNPYGPKPNWINPNQNQPNPNWDNPNLGGPRPNWNKPNEGGSSPNNPNEGGSSPNNPNQGGSSPNNPNQDGSNPSWTDPNQNQPNPSWNEPGRGQGPNGAGTGQDGSLPTNPNQDLPNPDLPDNNLDGPEIDLSELYPNEPNSVEAEPIPDPIDEPETIDNDINEDDGDFNWRNSNSAQLNSRRTDQNVNVRKPRWTRPLQHYPGHHNGFKPFVVRPRPIQGGFRPNKGGSKPWSNIGPGRSNLGGSSMRNSANVKLNKWNQLE